MDRSAEFLIVFYVVGFCALAGFAAWNAAPEPIGERIIYKDQSRLLPSEEARK